MLPPATDRPTMYFIGVTTQRSSIMTSFPAWAEELGLGDAQLRGIDLPLRAAPERYRAVADFIAADSLSLGALVTTHKIDMYEACADLMSWRDPSAELMHELSCLSKRDGRLGCHAKDPVSAGLALDALTGTSYWRRTGADAVVLGAGGSATAITWYLTRPERGDDRPARVVVSDRSPSRLAALRGLLDRLDTGVPLEFVLTEGLTANDKAVTSAKPGALIVNATGLGKDAPGSPLTSAARFPPGALAWDLNYRGELVFLDQARAAGARTEDGWDYFLHGWTQVIAEVFHITIPAAGPGFDRLSTLAAAGRR
jgi:shikimate 5-dehydrogenase